jgi:hypothetical protein
MNVLSFAFVMMQLMILCSTIQATSLIGSKWTTLDRRSADELRQAGLGGELPPRLDFDAPKSNPRAPSPAICMIAELMNQPELQIRGLTCG